jgi:hypothetical protein
MIRRRARWLLPIFLLASFTYVEGQYELPDEIFSRTLLVRSGNELATAFKFDHGGHMYLVTTRHLCKSLPLKNAVLQVWHGSWIELKTVRTIFPSVADVDLAVLETNEQIGRPYKVVKSAEVLTTGQKVWYMGWLAPTPHPTVAKVPHTSRPLFPEIPMVNLGAISAIDATQADSYQIHFDGSAPQEIVKSDTLKAYSFDVVVDTIKGDPQP